MLFGLSLFVLLVALSFQGYRTAKTYQYFLPVSVSLPPSYFNLHGRNGSCHVIHDMNDRMQMCEDLHSWEDIAGNRIGLLVTCDPGRRRWNTVVGPMIDPTPRGDLWFIDPSSEQAVRLPLHGYPERSDFHPLGISVLHSAQWEKTTVAVVNHGRHNSTIEVFDVVPPTSSRPPILTYRRTLTHRSIVSPNSIHMLTSTSALFSQDHTFTRRLPSPLGKVLPLFETFLTLPGGRVDYIDFSGTVPVITRAISYIPFANGIAVSHERHEVAVVSTNGPSVHFYGFTGDNPIARPLKYKKKVTVPFAPDNISFSRTGTLYVSGHRNFLYLSRMARSAAFHAPSWVSAIDDTGITTIYQSIGVGDEGAFGSSTTAVVNEDEKKMWASGLYETGVLSCTL